MIKFWWQWYNHHNANLWHKVLVSTLNGSSFRKVSIKTNTKLATQKNWGQRQSGRLRIFCWVSTRIFCANMSWWVHFGCVVCWRFFQFFESLIRYVLFENSFLKWCDWAPFLENRLLVQFVHFLIYLQYEDFETSLQAPLFENKRNVKQIRDATNVFLFVVLSTSFGVLPGVQAHFQLPLAFICLRHFRDKGLDSRKVHLTGGSYGGGMLTMISMYLCLWLKK